MRNVKSLIVLLLAITVVSIEIAAQQPQPPPAEIVGKTVQTNTQNSNKNRSQNTNSKDKSDNSKISHKSVAKSSDKIADKAEAAKAQAAFDELKNVSDATERIDKLNKFIADFPRSELKTKVTEMLIVSEIEQGEADFRSSNRDGGTEHFRRASRAFEPTVSDNIFKDLIVKLPFNLFYRGAPLAALAVAREIESKASDNPARLLALVNFYLSTENADEARRLAAHVVEIAPDSSDAQMSLGMAQRIAFHLEASAQAYARALELDATSVTAKRNLADAWRGLGQTEDALKLYRELLAANAADEAAHNGLVLALFDAGNKDEAEKELAIALEQNPKNLILQTGAAYWYAANGEGAKAVELAQKAVETEPRYVWGQIALARGLILEKRPLEAERALITARQYGKFPTLDYELSSVHFALGLYDEATDDLRRSFILENGKLQTKLAGREDASAENFNELLSRERRASIFETASASSETEARKLKELLTFADNLVNNQPDTRPNNQASNQPSNQSANADKNSDESAQAKAAQDFVADADEMQVHRELYAADKLLSKKIALEQVLAMTQNATGGLEKSLDVPDATAAVLADELYEPRRTAALSGNIVNIPTVARETLRQIMRGRVEEIAGWALYQENKPEEAVVRLRRAVGVLPENSAWWRSSYWRLGSALEAGGKSQEALDAYVKSYQTDAPNEARLVIIQSLYQRLYGSLDGFEQRLNRRDTLKSTIAQRRTALRVDPVPANVPSFKNPLPNVIGEILPPKPVETSKIAAVKTVSALEQTTATEAKSQPTTEIKIAETKIAETPERKPAPAPEAVSSASPEVKTETAAATTATLPEPSPETKATAEIVPSVPEAKSQALESQPLPATEIKTEEKIASETKIETKTEDKEIKAETKTEDKVESKAENKTQAAVDPTAKTPSAPEIKDDKTTETLIKPAPAPETPDPPAAAVSENIAPEKKTDELDATKKTEKKTEKKADSSEMEKTVNDLLSRPRVIIVPLNNLPAAPSSQPESQTTKSLNNCSMQVNQSEFSILRNGGTVALIVTFDNSASAAKLNVNVSSPSDIGVAFLPNDDADGNHRLIQISSLSEVTKIYTITLESPCGREEVKVKVR